MGALLRNFMYAVARSRGCTPSIEECYTRLSRKYFKNYMSHRDVDAILRRQGDPPTSALISAKSLSYFMLQQISYTFKARADLVRFFADSRFMHEFCNLTDDKLLMASQALIFKSIKVMRVLHVDCTVFEGFMTPNTPYNFSWRVLRKGFTLSDVGNSILLNAQLFDSKRTGTFPIRFCSNISIDLDACLAGTAPPLTNQQRACLSRVIFHFHGGGFIAMSSNSHQGYLRKIVREAGCCVFSVDYPLAPASRYKATIDVVFKSYLFLIVR